MPVFDKSANGWWSSTTDKSFFISQWSAFDQFSLFLHFKSGDALPRSQPDVRFDQGHSPRLLCFWQIWVGL